MKRALLAAMVAVLFTGLAFASVPEGGAMDIEKAVKKFAPVKVMVDPKIISAKDKAVIDELIEASRYMDKIFLRQVWSGNEAIRKEIEKAGKKDKAKLAYFDINFGPYDRLDHNKPFVEGVGPKPKGANFYPEDITKEEFEKWLKENPKDKKLFESGFTVIKRKGKELVAVPYSEEYADLLKPAAEHMKRAAGLTDHAGLKKYLTSRADALLSDDYFSSDVNWMRLEGHGIEVVVGPYEVYEDELMGYKTAFESFVTVVDMDESRKLEVIGGMMGELEKNLPIEESQKGAGRSLKSPIVVAQEVYSAGDTRAGVQTIAFNLPNDEKVRKQEGSKKVMLKNVQHAKFDMILVPIAKLAIKPEDAKNVGFDAFFAHTLLHEVSHGLGPGEIVVNGKKTTVNKELKDAYSTIEECKADALGLYNNVYLIEKGVHAKEMERTLWPTYLAGIFRSVRFGVGEAHGGGNAIQLNYLMDKGAITYDAKGQLFGLDMSKANGAIRDLAHDLLTIETKGDYAGAKAFVEKYRVERPELKAVIAKLKALPVDIRPEYAYK